MGAAAVQTPGTIPTNSQVNAVHFIVRSAAPVTASASSLTSNYPTTSPYHDPCFRSKPERLAFFHRWGAEAGARDGVDAKAIAARLGVGP
jgi:hypothetical protein